MVKVVSYVLGSVWENTGSQLTGTLLRAVNIFVFFFSKIFFCPSPSFKTQED